MKLEYCIVDGKYAGRYKRIESNYIPLPYQDQIEFVDFLSIFYVEKRRFIYNKDNELSHVDITLKEYEE